MMLGNMYNNSNSNNNNKTLKIIVRDMFGEKITIDDIPEYIESNGVHMKTNLSHIKKLLNENGINMKNKSLKINLEDDEDDGIRPLHEPIYHYAKYDDEYKSLVLHLDILSNYKGGFNFCYLNYC